MITIQELKRSLKINLDDDTDDNILNDIVIDANNEIDKNISRYIDVPIDQDSRLYNDLKYTILIYAKARWFQNTFQVEQADSLYKEYDNKLTSLITKIKSTRPNRTRSSMINIDIRDRKTPLPSQIGLYVLSDHI